MKIDDLEYLEIDQTDGIVGGLYVDANAQTVASSGFASANANAVANGDYTSTLSRTNTNVIDRPYSDRSIASANALALAADSFEFYRSTDSSKSWYANVSYS